MMKAEDRFIKIYGKGFSTVNEIWVDRVTGVNYLFHECGHAGGLCPLLDKDGKPVITQPSMLEGDWR